MPLRADPAVAGGTPGREEHSVVSTPGRAGSASQGCAFRRHSIAWEGRVIGSWRSCTGWQLQGIPGHRAWGGAGSLQSVESPGASLHPGAWAAQGRDSKPVCSILRPSVAASSQGTGVPAGPRAYSGSCFRGQRGRGGAPLQSSEPVPALDLPLGPRPLQPCLAGPCESNDICRGRLSRAPS